MKFQDKIHGGLADKSLPSDFDSKQLKKGIDVEMEHTNNPKIAMEIAMDHLKEIPNYYDRLEKVENNSRWEKMVNRRWNEALGDDNNFEEFVMANNPEVSNFNEITIQEKERLLREKNYLSKAVNIETIKEMLKNTLGEDLTYSHTTDATKNKFDITSEDGTSLKYRVDGMVDEIAERVMAFMPNSSSVEVKKKCKLGGNPDGTSEPCNKGDIKNLTITKIKEINDPEYSKWKRDNVTYRGISDTTDDEGHNGGSAILGRGLYSVPASNKSMAKSYGRLAILVNAKPKKPKIFNTINEWEIWFQNTLVFPISKANGKKYPDSRDFFKITNIENEMKKLGYDGVIIKGREMVNYTPQNVYYFYNENQLMNYYENMRGLNEESNRIKTNIGYFDIDTTIAPSNDSLFISHLEVKPELRGQGYFKELLNSITQEAKKRGKTKIVFDPDITQGREYLNKLTSIYKHHGFENDVNDPSLLVKNLNENHRDDLKYGVVMAMFPIKKWNEIVSMIDKNDIYDKPGYGLEEDPHITVLYGFHDDVNSKEVLERLTENISDPITAELVNISIFESKEYDVVKFDVKSDILIKLNKICKEFPHTSSFPNYHPHMTIAYVKKGSGKKYIKEFSRKYKISTEELVFSNKNKKQDKIKINELFLFEKKKSKFKILKDKKKPLTDKERKEVMDANAVWHFGINGAPSPAVWKSIDSNGDTVFISNTHRAMAVSKSLKAAINKFNNFIKDTA